MSALRLAYAAALVLKARRPRPQRGAAAGPGRETRVVMRVLAARHALQAAVTYFAGGHAVDETGAYVDLAHAASMAALAAARPDVRRRAALDAGVAAGFAATGFALASGGRATGRRPRVRTSPRIRAKPPGIAHKPPIRDRPAGVDR